MPYAYSNSGLTFFWHDPSENYVAKAGEQLFSALQTPTELAAAFAGYTAASAGVSAGATFATKLAAGIDITAGGASNAPVATFALDPQTQSDLAGIAATAAFTAAFPGSGSTFQYPDITGTPQTFPSIAAFKAFYVAYTNLVLALKQQLAVAQAGGSPAWPSQSVALT